jgi:hypothetical protein
MKFVLTALMMLSIHAFAGTSKSYQTDKNHYGSRSDGRVVPMSKETRRTTVKERPQMEEADTEEVKRTKKTTIRKTKMK